MRTMLWAHPRSRSTAFERAFIERGDCVVLHEPFSKVFYHDADEIPLISAVSDPATFFTSPLLDDVRYKPAKAIHSLVKDMPAHANYPDSYIKSFTHHVLLIREPGPSIRSFFKVDPNFDAKEAGYIEMLEVARRLQKLDMNMVIIESDRFAQAPKEVMTALCDFLGVAYMKQMVEWEKRMEIPAWDMWTKFHTEALGAQTITTNTESGNDAGTQTVELPKQHIKLVEKMEPIYREILSMTRGQDLCSKISGTFR